MKEQVTAEDDFNHNNNQWHRLSPLAMIHILIVFLKGFLNHGSTIAPIVILVVAAASFSVALKVIAVLCLISLIYSFFAYICFKYRLDQNRILIMRGVLTTKKLTLGYDRVQSVNIFKPFYFRPFGLAVLKLDSAGSNASEVALFGITKAYADYIRSDILTYQKTHPENDDLDPVANQSIHCITPRTEESDGATAITSLHQRPDDRDNRAQGEGELLTARSVKDLVKFGLSSNNIWIFVSLATPLIINNADKFSFLMTPRIESFIENIQQLGIFAISAVILLILISVLTVLLGLGILLGIIQHYRFRLVRQQDRLIKTSGLLELKEISLKESRIQALSLSQNFIAKLMGIRNLSFHKAGNNLNLALNAADNFVVPALGIGQQEDNLVARIYPAFSPADLYYKTIDKSYIYRTFLIFFFAPICFLSLGIFALKGNALAVLVPLIGVLAYPFYVLRYRRFGYALTKDYIAFKSGLLGQSVVYAEIRKIQKIALSRSPHERRKQLATIKIFFAGKVISIPLIPLVDAQFMADYMLLKAENETRDWM